MKPIPIKIQKIIMVIPLVNYTNWFILFYNELCLKLPKNEVSKAMLIAAICIFTFLIPRELLSETGTFFSILGVFLGNYIAPMLASYILIKCQEKLGVP